MYAIERIDINSTNFYCDNVQHNINSHLDLNK